MIRLGLQLTLHSGREAFVRLLVTAAAVAVGGGLMDRKRPFTLLRVSGTQMACSPQWSSSRLLSRWQPPP
jgi:hypothetical protein